MPRSYVVSRTLGQMYNRKSSNKGASKVYKDSKSKAKTYFNTKNDTKKAKKGR